MNKLMLYVDIHQEKNDKNTLIIKTANASEILARHELATGRHAPTFQGASSRYW